MKWFTEFLKKMDKTKWLILGLSGILLLVVALPVDRMADEKEDTQMQESLDAVQMQENLIKTYEQQLTGQLEQTLRYMDGVGQVHVMITFQDNGENIVEKDILRSDNGQDTTQYQESAIYQETEGREPYVSQQKLPTVEGVLIIAEGGDNSAVKQDIRDAVMALFPLEAHKIKIVKMQKGS